MTAAALKPLYLPIAPDPAPPLPILLANSAPLCDAATVEQVAAAAEDLRGTVEDADLILAAFFRLLSVEPELPASFSFLLAQLLFDQEQHHD